MKPRFNGWKMDPEAKRIWVEALRSGEYNQVEGALFSANANGYCCLGLKCKLDGNLIHRKASGWYVDKTVKLNSANYNSGYINRDTIPQIVQDVLAQYNDEGKSFNWIAAYIDRYL